MIVARVKVVVVRVLVLDADLVGSVLVMRAAPENGVSHEREERDERNNGVHRTRIQAKGIRRILLHLQS